MAYGLLGITAALALVDWHSVFRRLRSLEYFAKPATLVALLAWFWIVTGLQGWAFWFGLGLFFSLGGDIFLMLPGSRFFLPGLVSFLLAHLSYILTLNPSFPAITSAILVVAGLVAVAAVILYRRIAAGLTRSQAPSVLRGGVLVYSLAISVMVFSAIITLVRPGWSLADAACVALGGVLFFASDSILALDRFVAPVPQGRLWVIVTYHLGQLGLAFGLASHFLAQAAI